jgi:iron complex transport system permease protein
MVLVSNEAVFYQFRFWSVGSLQGRGLDVALTVLPFIVLGVILALCVIRPLNAMALGDEMARSLGASPGSGRIVSAVAVVLLAGAATAAAGPIAFIGLAAPHIVRMVVGGDHRLLIPGVIVVAPAFLVLADSIGRWVLAPAELQTGLAAAFVGAPIFIMLVRSRRVAAL